MLLFDAQRHLYFLEKDWTPIPGTTEILKELRFFETENIPPQLLEESRQKGEIVHSALEYDDQGTLDADTVEDWVWPYIHGHRDFKAKNTLTCMEIEKEVFSNLGFACRLDRVYLNLTTGEPWLIDIKTGSKYRHTRLQTASNQIAYEEASGKKIVKRGALYIAKDGTWELSEHKDVSDLETWIKCVELFHWKKPRYSKGKYG